MLTQDKTITTADYWDRVYDGANKDAKVDSSNTQRPPNTFDRFSWVAGYAEGPFVLGVASGHAHIEKRIVASHPGWAVIASDQSDGARFASKFKPYEIMDAYHISYPADHFNTIICAQALEYMDHQEDFLHEAKRVSTKLILTVPIGEMDKWSQLRIYTEETVRELLEPFGTIEVFERQGDLLLVKLKFND